MDYTPIEKLLDKYWNCETSLEEEEELRLFFTHHKELPPHLVKFREVFEYQKQEKQVKLNEKFDRQLMKKLQEKIPRELRIRRYLLQVAALLILCLVIREAMFIKKNEDTEKTPEQALQEVQQALNFVSQQLNKSQMIVEKNIDEIKTVTKYIKE